jgi:3-vinyl bacteriochlorophyllide hydratase
LTFLTKTDKLMSMPDSRRSIAATVATSRTLRAPLYTPEERLRRDSTYWTFLQGLLAPIQFVVFLGSLGFVLRYLWTGVGLEIANNSVVAKTLMLYTIMITGCIWEKVVFGRYLFAPAFFWEDVFSMLVLALHTSYLVAMYTGRLSGAELMYLALAAYATYVINAGQFILKLRAARLDHEARLRQPTASTSASTTRRASA